ncbi:MAG: hypothetical protein QGI21_06820 [Candidatus Poseidoniaceae archaeon]|jgi:hypothetical protein|nr:hypothetical protein [Candidatus Poseidoniaceae archaeon]
MRVCDIASNGLVFAIEPKALGLENKDPLAIEALGNILKAQQFDAIPLVSSYGGDVTMIARRRLHDGDLYETFILNRNEVQVIPRRTSIIESIFLVLSNEHHIVFLEDDDEKITDILTLSMLNAPKVKSYLNLKVSELTEKGWEWNNQYLGTNMKGFDSELNPKVNYANLIYSKLTDLALLVRDDAETPTDYAVSKLIVEILSLIQPLKPYEGEEELITKDDFYLPKDHIIHQESNAKTIQTWPVGTIFPNKEEAVHELPFEMFSTANNWDRLLLCPEPGSTEFTVIERKEGEVIKSIAHTVKETATHNEIATLLAEDNNRLIVVNNEGSKWPGVITIHDFALNQKIEADLVKRLAIIETRCRIKLLCKGDYFSTIKKHRQGRNQELIQSCSFADIISMLKSGGYLEEGHYDKLETIRKFRNRLVHDIVGYPLNELPIYHFGNFLEAYQYSIELEKIFNFDTKEFEANSKLLVAMGGLSAFALQKNHKGPRKVFKSKLLEELNKISINERVLTIILREGVKEVNIMLDTSIGGTSTCWRDRLFRNFQEIDEIIVKSDD